MTTYYAVKSIKGLKGSAAVEAAGLALDRARQYLRSSGAVSATDTMYGTIEALLARLKDIAGPASAAVATPTPLEALETSASIERLERGETGALREASVRRAADAILEQTEGENAALAAMHERAAPGSATAPKAAGKPPRKAKTAKPALVTAPATVPPAVIAAAVLTPVPLPVVSVNTVEGAVITPTAWSGVMKLSERDVVRLADAMGVAVAGLKLSAAKSALWAAIKASRTAPIIPPAAPVIAPTVVPAAAPIPAPLSDTTTAALLTELRKRIRSAGPDQKAAFSALIALERILG